MAGRVSGSFIADSMALSSAWAVRECCRLRRSSANAANVLFYSTFFFDGDCVNLKVLTSAFSSTSCGLGMWCVRVCVSSVRWWFFVLHTTGHSALTYWHWLLKDSQGLTDCKSSCTDLVMHLQFGAKRRIPSYYFTLAVKLHVLAKIRL